MKSSNFEFRLFTENEISEKTSFREGETKLGEKITTYNKDKNSCNYVILSISEDFGPQANGGKAGSNKAFDAFSNRFLNMQSNQFLSGENILFLGEISSNFEFNSIDTQSIIAELDEFVISVLENYLTENQIPIVIGGGHNNAFPLIKYISKTKNQAINVINLDAHADFRKTDFRHSGNPFSWAKTDGFLNQYAVLGLHQSYNNQYIIEELIWNKCLVSWFDDYISNESLFKKDVRDYLAQISQDYFGIELDLDAIAFMPSSAMGPSGLTLEQARFYIKTTASKRNVRYLHLPEGAPKNEVEAQIVGKTLAYLVSDFIKGNMKMED
jgi:formiminoglutamase